MASEDEQLLRDLVIESSQFLSQSDSDKAVELLQPHFHKFQTNPIYLQTLGESFLENSDLENAYDVLTKACELDPEASKGVEKFLYLGQIIGGEDGVKLLKIAYEKLLSQLEIIERVDKSNFEMDESMELLVVAYGTVENIRSYLIKKLNQALFASIEIWMTDLCMLENAEQECENIIQLALKLDAENGETWSLFSSIRISQQRNEEAKEGIIRSWDLFYAKKSRLEELTNSENVEDGIDINEVQMEYIELSQPLLTLAKYAIELGLFEIASSIASSVQDINEQSVESFYLEGFSNLLNAKRLQNSVAEEDGYKISQNFEDFELNAKIDQNDPSWTFVNDSRIALSGAFKLLQVDSIAEEIEDELKETIPALLNQVGGLLLKVKDTANVDVDESNWETEIPMDD